MVRSSTKLTLTILVSTLMAAAWWNIAPGSVRLIEASPEVWRVVKVGPGWPLPSSRYEVEWWGTEPTATEVFRPVAEDEAAMWEAATRGEAGRGVVGVSGYWTGLSWVFNLSLLIGLAGSLGVTIRRATHEARGNSASSPRPRTPALEHSS